MEGFVWFWILVVGLVGLVLGFSLGLVGLVWVWFGGHLADV